MGGESSSSATFLVEAAPKNKRGISGSWANFGSTLGALLGSGMATLTITLLDDTVLMAWGWRLPFLFGGLLGCLAIFLRIGLPKSEHFQNHIQNKPKESPLKAVFTTGLKETMQGFIFDASYGVIYYSTMVYLPTWVSKQTSITLKQSIFSTNALFICHQTFHAINT